MRTPRPARVGSTAPPAPAGGRRPGGRSRRPEAGPCRGATTRAVRRRAPSGRGRAHACDRRARVRGLRRGGRRAHGPRSPTIDPGATTRRSRGRPSRRALRAAPAPATRAAAHVPQQDPREPPGHLHRATRGNRSRRRRRRTGRARRGGAMRRAAVPGSPASRRTYHPPSDAPVRLTKALHRPPTLDPAPTISRCPATSAS